MPQSLSNAVIHIIFSTKNREPFLDDTIIKEMFGYLASCTRSLGWECYRVGGVKDHVHLAVRQPRTANISDLLGHIKRNSTKWIHGKGSRYKTFSWQGGYASYSVSPKHLDSLLIYIDNQAEHHKKISFKDEYIMFLKKNGIEYDERYVWD